MEKNSKEFVKEWLRSWAEENGNVNTTSDILSWVDMIRRETTVSIQESSLNNSNFWFYDDYNGEVTNRKRSFFSIKGVRKFVDNKFVSEQPIIVQPEIGYLGIICKKINGVINFLMQAKIEPGNINYVQISPTIQATKSNFMRVHGGKLPPYFEYFENAKRYKIVYDQIQSEQSSRFLKKRNRNIIIMVDEEVQLYNNYKWMTLGQIKALMKYDNLINMDTRTVISGLPISGFRFQDEELKPLKGFFSKESFFNSVFESEAISELPQIYYKINNYKMFQNDRTIEIPLFELTDWEMDELGITCKKESDFVVKYYDVSIEGREVTNWNQPLFKAIGHAVYGMIISSFDGCMKILVRVKSEIGTFDKIELAPSIQWDATHSKSQDDYIEAIFRKEIETDDNITLDVMLSEEGGRFYQEQNRYIVVFIEQSKIEKLPKEYVWVSYSTLNVLVQINNCLNIQLRNLLSTLDI